MDPEQIKRHNRQQRPADNSGDAAFPELLAAVTFAEGRVAGR